MTKEGWCGMRRITLKRVLLAGRLAAFLIAEGLLVAYVRRTEVRVKSWCQRAEAAAQMAEAATR